MAKDIHELAVKKGWWTINGIDDNVTEKSIGEQFANFHGEVSEAWEEHRNGKLMSEVYYKDGKPEGIPIELADLIIRVLDTCSAYNIDIEKAIGIKHEYNETRSFRHGGKLA